MENIEVGVLITNHVIPWTIHIAAALAIFILGRMVARLIVRLLKKVLTKANMDPILINFVSSIVSALLLLFIGWEIMGLCSYLLIGFWFARKYEDPARITPKLAGLKAFLTTRIGDAIMFIGMMILYVYSVPSSLEFKNILAIYDRFLI